MPWDAKSFAAHNKGLSAPQSAHAARIANAVLKRSGDEGMAIATANKYFRKRDDGGAIDDDPTPDMTDRYNTQLTPEQEAQFQRSPYANDTRDYDARGEFAAGANRDNPTGHGGDRFKKPNHPTFSDQSQYHGVDGHQGGVWQPLADDRWRFTPSPTNLKMWSPDSLKRYFQDREPGNELALPQQARGGIVRYDYGGGVSDSPGASPAGTSGSDTPGVMPSTATQNPLVRGMAQRYATMSPEQLQELAVRMKGTPQGQMIQTMLARKRMMPQAQGLAPGGLLSGASPATRAEEDAGTTSFGGANGYLHGPTPGRADQIMTSAPAGSHVIPADVIGGLGDGNSTAGAGLMTHMLRTGPWGVPMPPGGGRRTMPSPPRPPAQQARGGATDEQRPVALSHGEFVITPEQVAAIGDGDMQRGHKIIDQWIVEMRKMIIAQMSKLPRPVGMKK